MNSKLTSTTKMAISMDVYSTVHRVLDIQLLVEKYSSIAGYNITEQ
jgi:hypothetical protein